MNKIKQGMSKQVKRDLEVLSFLWKYKVATTAMIHTNIFFDISVRTAYNILLRLRRKKIIATRTDEFGKQPVWTLESKGFKVVKDYLPELRTEGFRSDNKNHDLICTSIHLGEYIRVPAEDVNLITEQMLRSYHQEFLPEYIPNVEEHRPDGYWYFKNGNTIKLMSLEVELSQKSFKRYEAYASFYDEFSSRDRCLWVVKTKSHAKKILRAMYKEKPEYMVHNFVLLKDMFDNGWSSTVFAGPEKSKLVSSLFYENSQYEVETNSELLYNNLLLDNRLTYQLYSKKPLQTFAEKVDSIGIHSGKTK